MKDETKKERDQQNGRDLKSKDKRGRSPRRDRSRSPVDRRNKDSAKATKRVYVANVSFDTHWSEIKVSGSMEEDQVHHTNLISLNIGLLQRKNW